MDWQSSSKKIRTVDLVDPKESGSEIIARNRFRQGPAFAGGELCEILPGFEAVVLVSPSGEMMLMQGDGKTVLHVPQGWRVLKGTRPLTHGPFRRAILDNVPELYADASPYCK